MAAAEKRERARRRERIKFPTRDPRKRMLYLLINKDDKEVQEFAFDLLQFDDKLQYGYCDPYTLARILSSLDTLPVDERRITAVISEFTDSIFGRLTEIAAMRGMPADSVTKVEALDKYYSNLGYDERKGIGISQEQDNVRTETAMAIRDYFLDKGFESLVVQGAFGLLRQEDDHQWVLNPDPQIDLYSLVSHLQAMLPPMED